MHTNAKGWFCDLCSKQVHDFTKMPYGDLLQLLEHKKEERICGAIPMHYTYPRLQTLHITLPSPQQKRSVVPGPFWSGLAGVLLTISFATAQEPDSLILPPIQDSVELAVDSIALDTSFVEQDLQVVQNQNQWYVSSSGPDSYLIAFGDVFGSKIPPTQDSFPLLCLSFRGATIHLEGSIFEPAYAEFLIQRHGEEVYFTLLSSNLSELAADLMAKAFPGNVPVPLPWNEFPLDVAVLPVSWSFEDDPRRSTKA